MKREKCMKTKRKNILLSVAVLIMFLMGMSMTAAASTKVYKEDYCGVCKAKLVEHGTHVGHYNDTHEFFYVVDGNQVVVTCDVAHSIARVYGYCPTHGLRWSANEHTEVHSSPNCSHYKTVTYYE